MKIMREKLKWEESNMLNVRIIIEEDDNSVVSDTLHQGDYYELHNKDWDELIQNKLDNYMPDDNNS